jgi:hypothetical protein
MRSVYIHVEKHDALSYEADALALKYAQMPYGVDKAAIKALGSKMPNIAFDLPVPGDYRLYPSMGQLAATQVLFAGTPPLLDLRYQEIRVFGRTVLEALAKSGPSVTHIALTVHGAGFGLDEMECFESLIAGLLDSLVSGGFPSALSDIAIVENDEQRADRLDSLRELCFGDHG